MEGEFLSLEEFVVVSPGWGKFHRHAVSEGGQLDRGTVIGVLRDGGPDMPIVSPMRCMFVAWMAWAGERVSPGTPIARIVPEQRLAPG